ncbi:tyrosine-protein phosphatase [Haliea sp. E17]|uniref:tyrosine-protein phosphatase n=1 Tax=Haliea sp. E17 TaxID=3401576 RepID=UPI003AAB430C
MIDLHTHLLPGIDDGPDTLAQSLALCRIAVAAGTTHAVATPHIHPERWNNTREIIRRACGELRAQLVQQGIPLQLGFAAEVRLSEQIIEQLMRDEIPFYGEVDGFRIMLLEFPHGHIIPGSDKLVRWLLARNIRPLIAHPERNKQVMRDPDSLLPFLEAGCWLQVTAGSVIGSFGERAEAVAHQLLAEGKVAVVASDGHNDGPRQPALRLAFDAICLRYSEETARSLMWHTPAAITAGQFAAMEDTTQ